MLGYISETSKGNVIYGKIFATMFEGSMVGAGANVFAVMAYVISHMQPNKEGEEHVRLNSKILAAAIGESEKDIEKAIDYLCRPDADTTTPGHQGRRLVKAEQFVYHVVNGRHYRDIMNEDDNRAKAAKRQADYRARKKMENWRAPMQKLPSEKLADEIAAEGTDI